MTIHQWSDEYFIQFLVFDKENTFWFPFCAVFLPGLSCLCLCDVSFGSANQRLPSSPKLRQPMGNLFVAGRLEETSVIIQLHHHQWYPGCVAVVSVRGLQSIVRGAWIGREFFYFWFAVVLYLNGFLVSKLFFWMLVKGVELGFS